MDLNTVRYTGVASGRQPVMILLRVSIVENQKEAVEVVGLLMETEVVATQMQMASMVDEKFVAVEDEEIEMTVADKIT